MKQPAILLSTCLLFLIGCSKQQSSFEYGSSVEIDTITLDAPFDMTLRIPDFSKARKFSILDYGALEGDIKRNTSAIALAIDAASKSGAGTVVIPKGVWLTGKIHLQSNVNLHVETGATLLFSDNPEDYLPAVHTTWEGMECYNYSPLIYAYECENVAITGHGKLKAKMDVWHDWFARPPAHMNSLKRLYTMASEGVPVEDRLMVNDSAHLRPQFIQFNRCENVLLEGVTIQNSPFWVIHPYLSRHVTIRGVNVSAHGHNNDGVDPDMSENVLIENCVFDQGDDAIAIKSGRNQDAWRLNTPSRNIVMRNCRVKNGHQLVAIGSELSGGVENVFVDNCTMENGSKLFHLVFIKTNMRRGGYVRNIYVRNISAGKMKRGILGIETDVLYQWRDLVPTYTRRLTPISDVFIENIQASDVEFVSRILGEQEMPVKNVLLKNIRIDHIRDQPYIHKNLVGFKATGLRAN